VSRYVSYRDFDWVLLVLVLMICALGVVEIYSATLNTKFMGVHLKQVYWILGGVALMFIVSVLNYQALLERVPLLYLISIGSLLTVAVFGKKYLGARRWVQLGSFHFQPSEWVKLVLILAMAKYFADQKTDCTAQDIVKAGALVGVPMLMVLVQPDLGTALTYLPIAIMGCSWGG
jgi:rod shape determining protein RodA